MSIWTDEDGWLHVGIMAGGRRIHRRLPAGASKGAAKQLEADLRAALGRDRTPLIPGDPPLAGIMELYLEHAAALRSPETARYHALRIGPWLIGRRASEADLVAQRIVRDMRGHYKPATVNRSLGTLKAALTIAWRQRMIPEDYGRRIRRLAEHNARHAYLDIEQVERLAACASESVRAAIWIALLTGCRRGEILKLRPEDIQGKLLRIEAGNTKTLKQRAVPIVPALRPWLKALPLPINHEGLKTGFRRAREAAGMPDITFHDLRHSCASLLINMSTPLEVVRDILGHTTVRTTERYAHLLVDRQREALEGLSRAVKGRKRSV